MALKVHESALSQLFSAVCATFVNCCFFNLWMVPKRHLSFSNLVVSQVRISCWVFILQMRVWILLDPLIQSRYLYSSSAPALPGISTGLSTCVGFFVSFFYRLRWKNWLHSCWLSYFFPSFYEGEPGVVVVTCGIGTRSRELWCKGVQYLEFPSAARRTCRQLLPFSVLLESFFDLP